MVESKLHAAASRLVSRRLVLTGLGAASLMSTGALAATNWPDRPVTVIVPFPAGGNTDTMARLLADFLSKKFGQPFVIDNRPTAGGAVATGQVARATPDGYTLMFCSPGQLIIVPMLQHVNYDSAKEIAPLSSFGEGAFILGAKKSLPFNTVQELIAYAKAHPGKLNVASPGRGAIGHLTAALFAKRAGFDFVAIPYKGGAPALAALLAGEVDLYFGNGSELLPYADSDRVKLLAVSSSKRLKQLPNVPAVAELYPGFDTTSWNGLVGPVGLPKEISDALVQGTIEAAKDPTIVKRLTSLAIEPVGSTTADLKATIEKERSLYRDAVDAAGLKQE